MAAIDAPVVFLDRDGTINRKALEGQYVTSAAQLELLPGAADAVALLNRAGLRTVLVTNQRGIARGLMREHDLVLVHERLAHELAKAGARLDAVYFCPHEAGTCDCRKPATGMFRQAAAELGGVDPAASFMVGDTAGDMAAGRAFGLRCVLIAPRGTQTHGAEHVAPSLLEAARWILANRRTSSRQDAL